MGYVTNETVLESDGVATLTVAISVPSEDDPIEASFYLLVNTMDGSATATGLPQSLKFPIHFINSQSLTNSLASCSWVTFCTCTCTHTHTHAHTHTHMCTHAHTHTHSEST